MYMYMYIHVCAAYVTNGIYIRQLIFLGKVTVLVVLCCFALLFV